MSEVKSIKDNNMDKKSSHQTFKSITQTVKENESVKNEKKTTLKFHSIDKNSKQRPSSSLHKNLNNDTKHNLISKNKMSLTSLNEVGYLNTNEVKVNNDFIKIPSKRYILSSPGSNANILSKNVLKGSFQNYQTIHKNLVNNNKNIITDPNNSNNKSVRYNYKSFHGLSSLKDDDKVQNENKCKLVQIKDIEKATFNKNLSKPITPVNKKNLFKRQISAKVFNNSNKITSVSNCTLDNITTEMKKDDMKNVNKYIEKGIIIESDSKNFVEEECNKTYNKLYHTNANTNELKKQNVLLTNKDKAKIRLKYNEALTYNKEKNKVKNNQYNTTNTNLNHIANSNVKNIKNTYRDTNYTRPVTATINETKRIGKVLLF